MASPIHGLHWDLEKLVVHELLFMFIRPFPNHFCSVAEKRVLPPRSAIAMMCVPSLERWMGGWFMTAGVKVSQQNTAM